MVDDVLQPARGRLPIKLIMPKQGAERRVSGGGGTRPPFREVAPIQRLPWLIRLAYTC